MKSTDMHRYEDTNTTHYDQYMYITWSYYALTTKVQILQVGLMFQQWTQRCSPGIIKAIH